ncbi:MAG: ABC transporter permease [Anaerolineae bacterium]
MTPTTNASRSISAPQVRSFLSRHGFTVVLVVIILLYAVLAPTFLTITNLLGLLHAAVPMMVIASGLAMVIMTGKIDISVGSVALLTTSVGTILMVRYQMDPLTTLVILLVMGIAIGVLNGVLIVGLRISPLIVTLAMMLILRGLALEMTKAMTIGLPEEIRRLGNLSIGPVFVDILIAIGIMILMQVILARTPFGRQVVALGNDVDTSARLGIRVNRVTILTFVISSLLATVGGVLTLLQVGSSSSSIGSGLEFTAVSAVVIGGISLFGGEGSIIPGALRGVLILEIIRNGLNHLGADPYAYRLVNGAIIFVAMYADSLRQRTLAPKRTMDVTDTAVAAPPPATP